MMAKAPKTPSTPEATTTTEVGAPSPAHDNGPRADDQGSKSFRPSSRHGLGLGDHDSDAREYALDHAVHWGTTIAAGEGSTRSPEQILAAAAQFYDFLQGNKPGKRDK